MGYLRGCMRSLKKGYKGCKGKKMNKNGKKICIYQKIVVPLHANCETQIVKRKLFIS